MMLHTYAYLPILAATATEVTIGMIWYSDSLFGSMWKKTGGKAPNPKDLYKNLAMHSVAALFTAAALFIAISIFQKSQNAQYAQEGFFKIFSFFLEDMPQGNTLMSAMKTAGFIWLGFIAPSKACHTIWGSGNWQRFAIETAGQLVSLVAMAAVIAKLS